MMRRFTSAPKPASRVAAFISRDVVARRRAARSARRRSGRGSTTPRPARSGSTPRCRTSPTAPTRVSTFAPAASSAARPRLDRVAHLGLDAVDRRSSRRRCRRAGPTTPSSSPATQRRRRRARSTWSRSGSWPPIASSSSAASSTVAANGPIWSSDDANAIEPVARHARRTSASRRRRRTAPRAGGSSRRCRSRARAARSRPRPRPPSRRSNRRAPASRSCGLRVGPNAEFSVDEPIANSSRFVLPIDDRARGARRARTTVASYGGRQPSRMRDEHVVGMPRVHMLSLSATGTPASGPGSSPRATAASTASAAARASSASTRLNAWISASRASIAARCSSSTSRADRAPARTSAAMLARRRHGSSPEDARHPEPVVLGRGRLPRAPRRAARPGRTSSGRNTFTSGSGCAVGGTSCVSSADTCAAWSRIAPSSSVSASISSLGQREAGELRDVLDVGAGDPCRPSARGYLYGSSRLSGNSHHSSGAGTPVGIGIDAVDRARGQALVAPAAQLGDDHDVGAVVEDRAELRRAVPEARVAVDALRHLDAQRRVLPLRVALVLRDALEPRRCGHGLRRRRRLAGALRYDPAPLYDAARGRPRRHP